MACPGGVVGSGGGVFAVSPGGGIVDLGGIAIGPGGGSPGDGIAGFRDSRKCLALVKV